jgi:hypothetical protein
VSPRHQIVYIYMSMHSIMSFHHLCIHDTHLVYMHSIGVLEGVSLLEYKLEQSEEQQSAQEQEVLAARGGPNEDDLPECPDHQPYSFLKGKPRSILSLLCL